MDSVADGTPPQPPWEDDDFAALDFSGPDHGDDQGSVLDAFDVYVPARASTDEDETVWSTDDSGTTDTAEQPMLLVFTVTNPPGSVTVSVQIDGRIHHVGLSPDVTRMTELQLAEEIQVIADLARQQARAGQHALVAEFMTEMGHDPVGTRGFLKHGLGLPTPEDANDHRVHVFATRYGGDD